MVVTLNPKKLLRSFLNRHGLEMYRYPASCERLEPHLRVLMGLHEIDAVLDIGANSGQFAKDVLNIAQHIPIYSVEPNPAAYERLRIAAAAYPFWKTFNVALGRTAGEVTLNVTRADDFSSCLMPNQLGRELYGSSLEVARQIRVPMRTLDEFVATQGAAVHQKVLLKLDTQGFDMEVLLGGTNALRSCTVAVTECSLQPIYSGSVGFSEAVAFFEDAGFILSGVFPLGRDAQGALVEVNCVFVRKQPKHAQALHGARSSRA